VRLNDYQKMKRDALNERGTKEFATYEE